VNAVEGDVDQSAALIRGSAPVVDTTSRRGRLPGSNLAKRERSIFSSPDAT
jgi:hypothetical protein